MSLPGMFPGGLDPQDPDVLSVTLTMVNRRGLHARAAAKLVTVAEQFDANVEVTRADQTVSARSIMGLMMLGAGRGESITLMATGWDAHAAVEALVALIEAGFHEDD
jgi:phosphocarrier protein HPr